MSIVINVTCTCTCDHSREVKSATSHALMLERVIRLLAMSPHQTGAQLRSALGVNAFELRAALDTMYQRGIASSEGKGSYATWSLSPTIEPGEDA